MNMDDAAYEILGHYLDSLSSSIYLGSAKGFVFVEHDENIYIISPIECTEHISIFYSEGFLEIYTIWGRDGKNGVRILADIQKISVFSREDDLYIVIEPHGAYEMVNGVIGIYLKGARDMEPTIKSAIGFIESGRKKEEGGVFEMVRDQKV